MSMTLAIFTRIQVLARSEAAGPGTRIGPRQNGRVKARRDRRRGPAATCPTISREDKTPWSTACRRRGANDSGFPKIARDPKPSI